MAGDEELRARALLTEMQLRIAEGPHATLGIDSNAATDQIRAAFLQLTKQFHPARFGRMSTELQKLSNEVFLGIKGAHDQLQKVVGGAVRASSPGQSGSIPIADLAKSLTPDTLRRTGAVPAVQRPSPLGTAPPDQTQPFARGTQRPSTPVMPRPATPRPGTPPVRPSSPAIPRTLTPSEITRPGVQPPTAPPTRGTSPIPQQQRPTTPGVAPRPVTPRPATPPGAPPKPMDYNPGTIRYSGVQPAPTTPGARPASTPAFDERHALRESLMMLNDRKWAEARQALHTLAAKVPQSKNYRALLCYARGREAHAAGKPDEAQLEYQRALQLDPELDLAKQAIAELTRRR